MSRNRFRIGSIAVLFAVVVLCVAIFGVLTVSSAVKWKHRRPPPQVQRELHRRNRARKRALQ